jgi:hypothetical protein
MHTNDSATLTEFAEDTTPRIHPSTTVQAIAKVGVPAFHEPLVDVLAQRVPCVVLEQWDPMWSESATVLLILSCSATVCGAGSESPTGSQSSRPTSEEAHEASTPLSLESPVLEMITFDLPVQQIQMVAFECQPEPRASDMHVNTSRGASLEGMCDDIISVSPNTLLDKVKKPLPKAAIVVPPPKRRTKVVTKVSRRSSWLAKKACGHTSAVAAVHNVLMKKLNIVGTQQLESTKFEQYLKMFKEGLIAEQIKMIQELSSK